MTHRLDHLGCLIHFLEVGVYRQLVGTVSLEINTSAGLWLLIQWQTSIGTEISSCLAVVVGRILELLVGWRRSLQWGLILTLWNGTSSIRLWIVPLFFQSFLGDSQLLFQTSDGLLVLLCRHLRLTWRWFFITVRQNMFLNEGVVVLNNNGVLLWLRI